MKQRLSIWNFIRAVGTGVIVGFIILCIAIDGSGQKKKLILNKKEKSVFMQALLKTFPFEGVEYARVYPEAVFPDFRKNILVYLEDMHLSLRYLFPKKINNCNVYVLSRTEREEVVNAEIMFYKIETWYEEGSTLRAEVGVIWSKCDANFVTYEFKKVRNVLVVRDFGATALHCFPKN